MESKSRCLECSWMGSVVYKPCDKCAQHAADAELGSMARAIYERGLVLSMSKGAEGGAFVMLDGVLQPRTPTLNEAVRKALEATQ